MSENNEKNSRQEIADGEEMGGARERKIKVKVKKPSGLKRSSKRIINAVDVLIILLVFAVIGTLIAGISLREVIFGKDESEVKTIEYVVLFSGVDESLAGTIKNGDAVYSEDSGVCFGHISSEVEVDTYSVVGYKDGAAQMKPYPDKVNLTVTIRVDASYSEDQGYSVDGNRIALGRSYTMRFPGLLAEGECINIRVS